jgi:hypothetical protein
MWKTQGRAAVFLIPIQRVMTRETPLGEECRVVGPETAWLAAHFQG